MNTSSLLDLFKVKVLSLDGLNVPFAYVIKQYLVTLITLRGNMSNGKHNLCVNCQMVFKDHIRFGKIDYCGTWWGKTPEATNSYASWTPMNNLQYMEYKYERRKLHS